MIKQIVSGMANPAQVVAAEPAKMRSWQPKIDLVGDLRASDGADLSLQVSGIVQTIDFQSGDEVPAARRCSSSTPTIRWPSSSRSRRPPNSTPST